MTTISKDISVYSEALDAVIDGNRLPAGIIMKKQVAINQFEQLGLPTMKHEEWKYTYLAKILKKGFVPGLTDKKAIDIAAAAAQLPARKNEQANRIVLVDGVVIPELSAIHYTERVTVLGLADAFEKEETGALELFASLTKGKGQALTALNTALSQDGIFVHLAGNTQANLEIIFIQSGSKTIAMPRLIFNVEHGSQLNIVEQHVSGDQDTMINMVAEVFLDNDARLEWTKIQDGGTGAHQLDSVYVSQAAGSQYHCSTISLTGELLRNNQFVSINGEGAHANLGGLYILNGKQQADNLIVIDHNTPNATSNQLYKGLLDGESTGVFNGKIVVKEDAQKTNAFQSNKNILLSDQAAAYFRPQLEIFADDVKCSHGATSAEIEDHEIFYLRSRGIGKELSKSLLMFAFVSDVVEEILNEQVREQVRQSISSRLKIDF